MTVSKKEIFFISLTCALGLIAVIPIFNNFDPPFEPRNPLGSLIYILSGYFGLILLTLGSIRFDYVISSPIILSFFLFAWASIPITMFFSKGIFIIKRIIYTYFIATYLAVNFVFLLGIFDEQGFLLN